MPLDDQQPENYIEHLGSAPDQVRLDEEIAALLDIQKGLDRINDHAQGKLSGLNEACNKEIKEREEFIAMVLEAKNKVLEEEPDNLEKIKELEDILSESKRLLTDLKETVQPEIVRTKQEISANYSMHTGQIERAVARGRAFEPAQPTGPRTEKSSESDVDRYCKQMKVLRSTIHSAVKAIPGILDKLTSLFSKNKNDFDAVKERFNAVMKKDFTHTPKPSST